MKIAIMQPYFLPHLGYFQLINEADKFIVFDVVQYIKHGWVNRNRILSPDLEKGWQYIVVPVKKHHRTDIIKDIEIAVENKWIQTITGKLSYYKKIRAPFFEEVVNYFFDMNTLRNIKLVNLNLTLIKKVFEYLDIPFYFEICSQKKYDFSNIKDRDDWAFQISRAEKATCYINPIGGKNLFDKNKFSSRGISILFLSPKNTIYKQSKREFIPSLSIIDVLMFNPKTKIIEMLNEYELVE